MGSPLLLVPPFKGPLIAFYSLYFLSFFRYFATGNSFHSLALTFRVGLSTISKIVREVSVLIWDKFHGKYMPFPKTSSDWEKIADKFQSKWQFPHCIGALDGKHVTITAPKRTGSLYFNYKGTFSIVLMALVDSNYKFLYIDVGGYGRNSDGGIFSGCSLGKALNSESLNIPNPKVLPETPELGPVPYCFVADEAFPLQTNIMRPFPGRNVDEEQETFNYRLSRARRVVENAFGILSNRWRIFHTKIKTKPEVTVKIVKACCILHNMFHDETKPDEIHQDMEISQNDSMDLSGPIHVREQLMEYFKIKKLSWQNDYITRGSK